MLFLTHFTLIWPTPPVSYWACLFGGLPFTSLVHDIQISLSFFLFAFASSHPCPWVPAHTHTHTHSGCFWFGAAATAFPSSHTCSHVLQEHTHTYTHIWPKALKKWGSSFFLSFQISMQLWKISLPKMSSFLNKKNSKTTLSSWKQDNLHNHTSTLVNFCTFALYLPVSISNLLFKTFPETLLLWQSRTFPPFYSLQLLGWAAASLFMHRESFENCSASFLQFIFLPLLWCLAL